ncbi:MAG: hypothetical protein JWM80_1082 [Cyanobacteria bacterium RYN_339]|nr:hypothetical protein [Cyanobacteria bacterium RYN_339]
MPSASSSRRGLAALGLLTLFASTFFGCNEDAPTTPTASVIAGPTISEITGRPEGNSILTLKATAKDPTSTTLAFRWSVDDGQLLSSTSASVQWRLPTKPGTYGASVEVRNSAGGTASRKQRFTVDSTGTAALTGDLETVTTASTSSSTVGSGAFDIPTFVAGSGVSQPIIGASGNGKQAATPKPKPPIALPILQPIATPTPALPPPNPIPSPLPKSPPPTPEPGVPQPPPLRWVPYDSTKVPTTNTLRALHFLDPDHGWIVGSSGTVLFYNRTNPKVEPTLVFKSVGVSPFTSLYRVFFTSAQHGFISGGNGVVMRTLDAGATWQSIRPPEISLDVHAMVVVNDQIVTVSDQQGNVFRTESANDPDVSKVNWVRMPTKPAADPSVWASSVADGVSFPSKPNVAYFGGNGVYKLEAGVAPTWTKVLTLRTADGVNPSDGVVQDLDMPTENELWVSTTGGQVLRSFDAGGTWTRLERTGYLNREHNGNGLNLPAPSDITAISVPDSNNAFLAIPSFGVYDTRDAALTWRQMYTPNFLGMQITNVITDGIRDFVGWGVGLTGTFYLYKPGPG